MHETLGRLRVRDLIMIVGSWYDDYPMMQFREALAPDDQWKMLWLTEYPQISLAEEQQEALDDLMRDEDFSRGVGLWYYRPASSRGGELPEHELMEDTY